MCPPREPSQLIRMVCLKFLVKSANSADSCRIQREQKAI
ncbi:hypothetical protein SL1157_A0131 [Ruegeria lacuscaerulensis ITI-1157]|nr:hypothetical protein SL1157_A0131 [Ruegeria lacuscaerulensis ITI-1157]